MLLPSFVANEVSHDYILCDSRTCANAALWLWFVAACTLL